MPAWEDNERDPCGPHHARRPDDRFATPFTAAQIDGSEGRQITVWFRGQPKTFMASINHLQFAPPNLDFHAAMTYAFFATTASVPSARRISSAASTRIRGTARAATLTKGAGARGSPLARPREPRWAWR